MRLRTRDSLLIVTFGFMGMVPRVAVTQADHPSIGSVTKTVVIKSKGKALGVDWTPIVMRDKAVMAEIQADSLTQRVAMTLGRSDVLEERTAWSPRDKSWGEGALAEDYSGVYYHKTDNIALQPCGTKLDSLSRKECFRGAVVTSWHELYHSWQFTNEGAAATWWLGVERIQNSTTYGYADVHEQQAEAFRHAVERWEDMRRWGRQCKTKECWDKAVSSLLTVMRADEAKVPGSHRMLEGLLGSPWFRDIYVSYPRWIGTVTPREAPWAKTAAKEK